MVRNGVSRAAIETALSGQELGMEGGEAGEEGERVILPVTGVEDEYL